MCLGNVISDMVTEWKMRNRNYLTAAFIAENSSDTLAEDSF